MNLVKLLFEKLEDKTLSVAESITGGAFSSIIVSEPNASKYFKGGLIVYTNELKRDLLNIKTSNGVINNYTAEKMAINIKQKLKSDVSISFTGNAGPETIEGKDIGVSFIGICINDSCFTKKFIATAKERNKIIMETAAFGLLELIKKLEN